MTISQRYLEPNKYWIYNLISDNIRSPIIKSSEVTITIPHAILDHWQKCAQLQQRPSPSSP